MNFRSKSSHYTPVKLNSAELRDAIKLSDHLAHQTDVWREGQGLAPFTNAHLKTNSSATPRRDVLLSALDKLKEICKGNLTPASNARGDDDDVRTIIADLISDDASPFTPDDEMALRQMSAASLREMRRKYIKRKAATANQAPVTADPALKAMSAHVGLLGADFHMRANERKRMSDEYIRRNPVRAVTNSNDPAVQAMSAGGLLANLKKGA